MNFKRAGKILLFYMIFYAGLFGFFIAMLGVFYLTLDENVPKWQGDKGLIGNNPGLSFRPTPPDANAESTLVWSDSNEGTISEYWVQNLDKFLEPYRMQSFHSNMVNCEGKDKPDNGKFCKFDIEQKALGPCTKDYDYGFGKKEMGPCIFLKLNKIYGWTPEYYTNATAPFNMPKHLRNVIARMEISRRHHVVWVDCVGENAADIENMGAISYYPQRGFHQKYFPFGNVPGYVSPLVAVHFENPARGVLINIECKAWAHNIDHDRIQQKGVIHFELMIDRNLE